MSAFAELTSAHPSPSYSFATGISLPDDEAYVVARTLAGDVDAFNDLVVKYQGLAYGIAYRMLQSRDAAADVVQDSFLKAFRALHTFRYGSFKSWLTRIVVNTSLDAIRISRRLTVEGISDDAPHDPDGAKEEGPSHLLFDTRESPDAFVERMELSARIELGLRALPVEQRLVVVLSDIHGYRYEEISEVTGFAMGTVKSRISRARLKLREFLLQQPELLPVDLRSQS